MDPSRRQFFRARPAKPAPSRPPWALRETDFHHLCSRCDACIRACPQDVLIRGDGGFPEFDPRRGGCDFCADCLNACQDGALDETTATAPFSRHAVIGDACLAHRGVECRVCAEICDQRAIRVRLVVGGAPFPELDPAACNGCGSCVHGCPPDAIALHPHGARP